MPEMPDLQPTIETLMSISTCKCGLHIIRQKFSTPPTQQPRPTVRPPLHIPLPIKPTPLTSLNIPPLIPKTYPYEQ